MKGKTVVIGMMALGLLLWTGSSVWAADKPVVIRYADHGAYSKFNVRTVTAKDFADEVEKKSNGRVKFEFHWAEALCKAKDAPDAAVWELYDTDPVLQKDLDLLNARLLLVAPLGETILTFRKPVNNLKEAKGMLIRAVGSEADFIKGIGAVPVPLPHPEVFLAIQRGTIDGVVSFPASAMAYGYYELTTHWLKGIPGNFGILSIINKGTWDKISKDDQKMMIDLSRSYARRHADNTIKNDREIFEAQKARGVKVMDLSPADAKLWRAQAGPAVASWKKDLAARGMDGDKLLQKYLDLTKKYGAKY
ncbi:MAG: TRAP transporter substrate-binding protein DctP [Deltaproteobacteria bacterium]|nr:TRAP transporter substrate-binding protein DctP [Deltaproteobacteria bacterium]